MAARADAKTAVAPQDHVPSASPSDATGPKPPDLTVQSDPPTLEAGLHTGEYNHNDHERPVREALKKTSIGNFPRNDNRSVPKNEEENDTGIPGAGPSHSRTGNQEDANLRDLHKTEVQDRESNNRSTTSDGQTETMPTETRGEGRVPGQSRPEREGRLSGSRPRTPESGSHAEGGDGPADIALMSPRRKRSRDQFVKDLDKDGQEPDIAEADTTAPKKEEREANLGAAARTSRHEPEKKRHRDISQDSSSNAERHLTSVPPASGFANTSVLSPFGSLGTAPNTNRTSAPASVAGRAAGGKQQQTSSSAFAASGFAALANSSTSPFGALNASSGLSGFGRLGGLPKPVDAKSELASPKPDPPSAAGNPFHKPALPALSGLGPGASPFGALGGSLGGTFGSGGNILGSFGSKDQSGIIGSSQASTTFGAPEAEGDGDEDDDEDGEDDSTDRLAQERKDDRRAHQLETETGEEGEDTRFSCRAKLFQFDTPSSSWKERGSGTLKLNVSAVPSETEAPPDTESTSGSETEEDIEAEPASVKIQARLLMRSEGVYRVLLNAPIYREISVGDRNGDLPKDRLLLFPVVQDGKPLNMALRVANHSLASQLWHRIDEVKQEL